MLVLPQYDISHYFYRRFRDGGLTYRQIAALYAAYADREFERQCFEAAIHGINLRKELKRHAQSHVTSPTNQGDDFFKDPSAYEHMSEAEKAEATAKMKATLMQRFKGIGF